MSEYQRNNRRGRKSRRRNNMDFVAEWNEALRKADRAMVLLPVYQRGPGGVIDIGDAVRPCHQAAPRSRLRE
jgi:hypothetical protein